MQAIIKHSPKEKLSVSAIKIIINDKPKSAAENFAVILKISSIKIENTQKIITVTKGANSKRLNLNKSL